MTLEVRQLIVKSTVTEDGRSKADETDSLSTNCAEDLETIRADLLDEVRRMIRESLEIRGER